MIKPTVGRVVWFYPKGAPQEGGQPLAATVAFVHTDQFITIGFLHPSGLHDQAEHVLLIQEGEKEPAGPYCCWMPYQQGQAKKHSDEATKTFAENPGKKRQTATTEGH